MLLRDKLFQVLLETRETQAAFSRRARVSTRFVNQLLNDELETLRKKAKNYSKKAKGRAAALTRVATAIKYSVAEALAESGLSQSDSFVSEIVRRAKSEAERPRRVQDPVYERICSTGRVLMGVLQWQPLAIPGKHAHPFTEEYVNRLVHTLNPAWECQLIYFETIKSALEAVTVENSVDAVLGLFDTPGRRSQQLRFSRIGALEACLSAVWVGPPDAAKPGWNDLDKFADPIGKWQFVALEQEAGHRYLLGPCGFSAAHVDSISELEPNKIATSLIRTASRGKPVVLVTERALCKAVADEFQLPELRATAGAIGHELIESVPQVAYPMGFGLRADAEFWSFLLDHVQAEELFRNAPVQMGRLIGQLLAGVEQYLSWNWERLPDRYQAHWSEFAKAAGASGAKISEPGAK